jgi:hypothetical protein
VTCTRGQQSNSRHDQAMLLPGCSGRAACAPHSSNSAQVLISNPHLAGGAILLGAVLRRALLQVLPPLPELQGQVLPCASASDPTGTS